jgi:hypothetical protein
MLPLVLGACGEASTPRSPADAALEEAHRNYETAAGEEYAYHVSGEFNRRHQATLEDCLEAHPAKRASAVDILVRISQSGQTEELVFRPGTELTECIRKAMGGDVYPEPPAPSFWVHILVDID